ncbi:MAG: hypothetical protein KY468_17475, partial [Armatimonadetes bacterium]|nr:hypothetical protein [Armatimonadota bacterium]
LRAVPDTNEDRYDYCAGTSVHTWVKEIPLSRLEAALNAKKETRIGRLKSLAVERADSFGRAITLRIEGETPSITLKPTPKAKKTRASADELEDGGSYTLVATSPLTSESSEITQPVLRTLRATTLRSLLGDSVLKSTFFTVERNGSQIRFVGRGYGHGVGMCVAGANGMAKAGIGYREILARYYTGTLLNSLYDLTPAPATGKDN